MKIQLEYAMEQAKITTEYPSVMCIVLQSICHGHIHESHL